MTASAFGRLRLVVAGSLATLLLGACLASAQNPPLAEVARKEAGTAQDDQACHQGDDQQGPAQGHHSGADVAATGARPAEDGRRGRARPGQQGRREAQGRSLVAGPRHRTARRTSVGTRYCSTRCSRASTASRPTSSAATILLSEPGLARIARRRSPKWIGSAPRSSTSRRRSRTSKKTLAEPAFRQAGSVDPFRVNAPAQILIVEDKDSLRTMLRHALERPGHAVLEARDQPEAIRLMQQNQPALVLSDLRLPEGDGFGVLRASKEIDPDVPVIVMTAYGSIEDAVAAMKEGRARLPRQAGRSRSPDAARQPRARAAAARDRKPAA